MEEDGSVATSCMAVTRFMVPSNGCVDYQTLCHDPLFSSSPCPPAAGGVVDSTPSTMDSSDVANLLTDMLSADFPLYHTVNTTGRYTVPDILQFPASEQASKITLLQMLEESDTGTTSSFSHLKLPVLEEPCDQHKLLSNVSSSSEAVQVSAIPPASASAAPVPAPVSSSPKSLEIKPCKPEPADSVNVLLQPPPLLAANNQILPGNTSSENSAENKAQATSGGGGGGGGVSQSSSGTETPTPHQPQQHRPKRKRIKSCKNSEEVESQRQTHIAVERNRRKQMNEHLNVLRSLMPGSYVQRGDQASIIGGAIEFVKELEQLLQCLQAQKRRRMYSEAFSPKPSPSVTSMLQHQQLQQQQQAFFASPPPQGPQPPPYSPHQADSSKFVNDNFYEPPVKEVVAEAKSEAADIEVKMVGNTDVVVKILSQRRPGQLLKTISALENMCMTIVHTNITTIEQTVLYSFTVRIGMESRLAVEEIAEAIQRAFTLIHNSSTCSSAA